MFCGDCQMNKFPAALIAALIFAAAQFITPSTGLAQGELVLSNDNWPPFVIKGNQGGLSQQLVCQALALSGWQCSVVVQDWEAVLDAVKIGAIDGIVAAWQTPERELFLQFSEPYLTNRIVPVINEQNPVTIENLSDLEGLRVALVKDYAYGEEILQQGVAFETMEFADSLQALKAVQQGKADTALLDALVARNEIESKKISGVLVLATVLSFRELHFAVSRQHPKAAEIIGDFQRGYQVLLNNGTVNEILNIDWLATDFGHTGRTDLVLRSNVTLDELSHPSKEGSVYSLQETEYEFGRLPEQDATRVKYQVKGTSYSTLQSALDEVFGEDMGCKHKEFSSEFDCTGLFEK